MPDKGLNKRIIILASGFVIAFFVSLFLLFHDTTNYKKDVFVNIKPGMQTGEIISVLNEKGVIDYPHYFYFLAKLRGLDRELKVGNYVLHPNMSASAVLDILLAGPNSKQIRVVIPEGYTVEQIADLLSEKGIVDKKTFLELARTYTPYEYMKDNNPEVKYKVEGYLFPDTYDFLPNSSPKKVMDTMLKQFNKEFNAKLRARAKEKNLSIHEVVVLASLVEAEARYEKDRPIIAQVFFNRLKINMPLQSDTTIQYVLPKRKKVVTIADTKIDSPYNTYMHYGLPPGAVGNPGIASIKAVLYPEPNDYLYFVADSNGNNHYSHTYQQHLQKTDEVE